MQYKSYDADKVSRATIQHGARLNVNSRASGDELIVFRQTATKRWGGFIISKSVLEHRQARTFHQRKLRTWLNKCWDLFLRQNVNETFPKCGVSITQIYVSAENNHYRRSLKLCANQCILYCQYCNNEVSNYYKKETKKSKILTIYYNINSSSNCIKTLHHLSPLFVLVFVLFVHCPFTK